MDKNGQDLEWKLVYVGSAKSNDHDQVLDSIDIGPLSPSTVKFIFDAPPPDLKLVCFSNLVRFSHFEKSMKARIWKA